MARRRDAGLRLPAQRPFSSPIPERLLALPPEFHRLNQSLYPPALIKPTSPILPAEGNRLPPSRRRRFPPPRRSEPTGPRPRRPTSLPPPASSPPEARRPPSRRIAPLAAMGKRWRKHRARACKAEWDPKVAKRAPSLLEGPVMEYVSIVLKRVDADDEDESNVRFVVPGTMTVDAFTMKSREELNVAADSPLQLFVGPRSVRPDAGDLISSFPKKDYLYVSYNDLPA